MPSLAITSVGGIEVPVINRGDYKAPDIALPPGTTPPVTVTVSGSSIPLGTTVTVRAMPEFGNTIVSASGTLAGTEAASNASVQLNLSPGYASLLTLSATFQVTTALNGTPFVIDGEMIAQVRVDAQLGGASRLTYITESGREIPAQL
jgi:hypothetical protein